MAFHEMGAGRCDFSFRSPIIEDTMVGMEFKYYDGSFPSSCSSGWHLNVSDTRKLEARLVRGAIADPHKILGYGFMAITKVVFDQELALSEHRVKAADILNNPSLILGRQIIHVLPEG